MERLSFGKHAYTHCVSRRIITAPRRFYTFAVIGYVARKLRSRVYTQLQPECISFIADPLDAKTQARAVSLKIPRKRSLPNAREIPLVYFITSLHNV